MSAEVTEIINTLCEKLGVAANVLVPEMARYYIARLVFLTLADTILVIIMAIMFANGMKSILGETDLEERVFLIFFAGLIPGLVMTFLLVSTISNAADLIGWIASPTASAVREITRLIK